MTNSINDNTFAAEVLASDQPVLVDFSASWCGPCRFVAPVIDKLSEDYKDKVKVVKLDIDDAPETTREFGIRGVPTFVFFKDGKEIDRWVGANKSEKDFRDKLDSL